MPPVPPVPFDASLVLMTMLFVVAATIVLWPIARALGRRMEAKSASADPAVRQELDQMQHRIEDLDALQHRLAELEERVDFAERLLARPDATAAQLPRSDR